MEVDQVYPFSSTNVFTEKIKFLLKIESTSMSAHKVMDPTNAFAEDKHLPIFFWYRAFVSH